MKAHSDEPALTLPDLVGWRSRVSPKSLALKCGGLEWTYHDLEERVGALASCLLSRGISRGDRVALLMEPSGEYVALVHAVARLGGVAVPLGERQSASEISSQLADSAPSLVIHDDASEPPTGRGSGRVASRRWVTLGELAADSTSRDVEPVVGASREGSHSHSIIYTSGSSGEPKGVVLTLSNLAWNAISVGSRCGASARDRWLLCMPLFHVGGYSILFRSVVYGSAIVLHPRFDAKLVSESFDSDRVTLASFVPTMLSEVLDARGKPFGPSVRIVFLGGAPPTARLLRRIKALRLPVLLAYGMTETCSQVAVADPSGSPVGPHYQANFPCEVAVVKPAARGFGSFAAPGEEGEVVVRGPTLFRGYWRKPALTRARLRGGWFHTGDVGVLQAGGSGGLLIVGRRDETIISGGEKVSPSEVESALREHPAVDDAVVVGVEDAKWGERVVAVVETKPAFQNCYPSADELRDFLRGKIARHKVPKAILLAALPRTASGKIRRAAVRLLLEEGDDPS